MLLMESTLYVVNKRIVFFHCRDLPLAALISLLLIASVYTLANLAYFTALSPAEVLQSPAVALVGISSFQSNIWCRS